MNGILQRLLGPDYAHHVIIVMGLTSLAAQCAALVHKVWHGADPVDFQAFGIGCGTIIGATGAALGLGVKRDRDGGQ